MNLQDQGFRFVFNGKSFSWVHPLEVVSTHTDCTDMSDDEFEQFVAKVQR